MNQRLLLNLIAIPTLASSLLTLLVMPGVAAVNASARRFDQNFNFATADQASCAVPETTGLRLTVSRHTPHGVLVASTADVYAGVYDDFLTVDFSAAESDAAAALFGCDCWACINALRQLRRNPVINNRGQGHCWSSLARRASPQRINEVLQLLEAEER